MAVRRKINHNEDVKKRIQASQLVNRLQDNAFGKIEPELSAGQIKSIDILLRKTIPDLQSVAMTGEGGGPVMIGWLGGQWQNPAKS